MCFEVICTLYQVNETFVNTHESFLCLLHAEKKALFLSQPTLKTFPLNLAEGAFTPQTPFGWKRSEQKFFVSLLSYRVTRISLNGLTENERVASLHF